MAITSFVHEKTHFFSPNYTDLEYWANGMPDNKIQILQDLIKWTAMGFDSSEHHVSEIKEENILFVFWSDTFTMTCEDTQIIQVLFNKNAY